jgi:hypothetical protein
MGYIASVPAQRSTCTAGEVLNHCVCGR